MDEHEQPQSITPRCTRPMPFEAPGRGMRSRPATPRPKIPAWLVGGWIAVALPGCASEPAAACPQGQVCRPADEVDGSKSVTPDDGPTASADEPPQKKGLRYQDARDGGNDPFVAGCHYEYSDATCQTNTGRVYGDDCISSLDLREWVNQGCHPALPYDEVTHYCDYECKTKKNKAWGVCVTEQIDCGGTTIPSARCECLDEVPAGMAARDVTDQGPRLSPIVRPLPGISPVPISPHLSGTGGEQDTEGAPEPRLRLDPSTVLRPIDGTRLQPAVVPDQGDSSSGG